MYEILLGIAAIISAFVQMIITERCRRCVEKCKDSFMRENGLMFSVLAWPYIGRPDLAREAITQNPKLRNTWFIEQYIWISICLVLGIVMIFVL